MKRSLYILILYTILFFLCGKAHLGYAQKVKIFGNVYGGGELAQVVAPTKEAAEQQLIQDADLKDLFTTHADHVYTTYVHLGENSEVYGRVFGGGRGDEDSTDGSGNVIENTAGRVTGQTDVALDGATVWSEIYGGGEMADVFGNTLLHFKKGKAGHNAFGGGLGKLTEDKENNAILPDNRQTVLASADIKRITDWSIVKKTGESFVVFDGTENSYTHYEFEKARTINRDANGNPVKVNNLYYTETDQFDAKRPEQLFSINHNIYGGGMTASKVESKTFVHINYGMVNEEMMNFRHEGEKVWSMIYNSIANAQFCVFGGGYGYYTDIMGDANVTMDVQGDGKYRYIEEFTEWFAGEGKSKYGWDTNVGDPELIYKAADEATWSHGAPGRSCMDIVGGGYNGRVLGTANITVGGDVVARKVYGGGYYSSVGNTNVHVKSGIFNRVYGGGMIGNVYGKAELTFGQQGSGHSAENLHLLVKDAIYGGNDVSGTVGTTAPGYHTQTHPVTGVTYNVYNPVDDDDHGVRLNIYGGLVLGDVYGAGNGNHPGYGNPDYMEFNLSQHPSENYRQLAQQGTKGTRLVYKYRPRTGRVVMNIVGNAGTDFNDDPQVDKVRIWGRTFGGGNSCNVGIWDGLADDNPEVYADDASSWHPGDNFEGGGTIRMNIGSHVQLGNRNDSHETPNGLFMGCNGEHMITQHTDRELAKYYHQYYDSKAQRYYPGFVVYEADAQTPIKRTVGLKAFKAFINNILTKSDNVTLNIKNPDDTEAEDVWMSNFVGGGYRGSMQAATETGSFDYELPKGVTIGHSVVGGAFNAHIIYRVYKTEYGTGLYVTDNDGNYLYETEEPSQGVISKAEAEEQGLTDYDYIRKLYAEGHEGDDDYLEGYLRYNFDGGMLAHDSEMNATNTGSRIHKVHDPASVSTADFTNTNGYFANKDKALVHLTLKNRLQPAVHEADPVAGTDLNVHGGIVYGGCFHTGFVEGDSWVDYDCSLSPLCTDDRFFGKENKQIYDEVADLHRNNALNVFGAGYGVDTHSMGDVYLCIKSSGNQASDPGDHDSGHERADYPFIYNVFGGSNMGTVGGSTNVYYDGGKQGTMLGSLYGGGYKGDIAGNTFVELVQGFLVNVYGGSRQANIGGASHVWAYDGSTRTGTGLTNETFNHLIICNLYGGNDISGNISGTMPVTWTNNLWTDMECTAFNSYVQVAGTYPGTKGFPLVGNVYGGGNGEMWAAEHGVEPNVGKSMLEIGGGTTLRAFGGGNHATITSDAYIFVNASDDHFADVSFTEYQKDILMDKFFHGVLSGYRWDGNKLIMDQYHVGRLYGGNTLATMSIQPTWNLRQGLLENVYSGGDLGDMTYYNAEGKPATTDGELSTTTAGVEFNADGTNANYTPRGLSINVDSPDIYIKNLFGGCRLSNVVPGGYDGEGNVARRADFAECEDLYGATVNILDGNIENVYGGNDVGGKVYFGTNINISGGVIGNVYGSGNGNYLYQFDQDETTVTEHYSQEYGFYYSVPERQNGNLIETAGLEGSDTHKILTINRIRPSVDNVFINIEGMEHGDGPAGTGSKRVAAVSGNIFMGGNATTITRDGNFTYGKFKLGSYTTINGFFLGSDGQAYTQNEQIEAFAKLNDITDMGAETEFTAGHELDKQHNPILLNTYLMAVDMQSPPKDFSIQSPLTEAYIGTFCGGGNRGSMLIDKTVELDFPENLVIFDKVVAGCMDATVNYNHGGNVIKSVGGYTRMLDIAGNNGNGNTKIKYSIPSQFAQLVMDVPADRTATNSHGDDFATAMGKGFLYPRLNTAGDAYTTGCNIYGGCYQSGEIEGDVELRVQSNMLSGTHFEEAKLQKAIANGETCFNVFGAGFGQDSHVWGNVHITLDGSSPSVNKIFGGGRNGQLIGNTTIEVRNGRVYSDVAGGCYASDMYGSSSIIVGYPTYYECQESGEYALQRGDQWNTGNGVVKQSVKYLRGDLVPRNVYDLIADESKNTKFNMKNPQPADWTAVNIQVGKGVYGGGYSLANSTSASAGSVTTHKLTGDMGALHHMNFNGRYGIENSFNTEGYGGNSAIMVGDVGINGSADHISISTLKATPVTVPANSTVIGKFVLEGDGNYTHQSDGPAVAGTQYYDLSGDGGIYGDGHLTFCEGFRAADVTGYGYNTGTVKYPRLMNTFQRLDLLNINDCCLMLQGAQDFATNEKIDATIYSMTRIDELRMNSSLDADAPLGQISPVSGSGDGADMNAAKQRNYLGFFNNIHYLGSIVTNDEFASDGAIYHTANGAKSVDTYYNFKKYFIDDYSQANPQAFKPRNVGTARNCIGINNGFCLRIQNQYDDNGTKRLYYGPIVGVCEIKLLTLTQGEGGGYVYADNIHSDEDHFLNTSGNFVFPGVVNQGTDSEGKAIADQYIVDDCFVKHFGTPDAVTTRSGDLDEAHYWYVEGNKYFYNTTLTGYTYQDELEFNLIDTDPNLVLSGLASGSSLNVKKIEWISAEDGFHRAGYAPVLPNTTEGKVDDYEFDLDVNGSSSWTADMPRYSKGDNANPLTDGLTLGSSETPIFNVRLKDKLDNSNRDNYTNHLDEPELVKIYLEGENGEQTYEYTITLNVIYLQGPTYSGGVNILNCALPGERIGFSSGGIRIETPDIMPVTATAWKILPFKEIDNGEWKWANSSEGILIDKSMYSEDLQGNLTGSVPALYSQNEYNIAYIFTAGGHDFPVMPDQTLPKKEQRMMVVHNYHRMKDIAAQQIEESVVDGVRVYIEDEADLRAFVEWVNAGKLTAGVNFILQNDITLTSALALSQPFAGIFHGDGYHIDLAGRQSSLFADKLSGMVYNLGLWGGTISTADTRDANGIVDGDHTVNSYEAVATAGSNYGKNAYVLSHYFTPDKEGGVALANPADGYVHRYYADGDYQYATTDRVWSLRTGEPNYGKTGTRHDQNHDHDPARWVEGDGRNVPLYDGTMVVADRLQDISGTGTGFFTYHGVPRNYADDYLFFGQHLDKDNGDAYPVHISSVANGDQPQGSKGGNRVYMTDGYCQDKVNVGFCYNRDAWALQPTLTAIDFTSQTAEADGSETMPAAFSVGSDVTRNLLVYNAGEVAVFDKKETATIAEKDVVYHNIVKDGDNSFITDNLHLVDKHDFNAPIDFSVTGRIWYDRKPDSYRNVYSLGYESGSAWEGICLPFEPARVTASRNGVITHFYGDEETGHEYWLRGLKAVNGSKAEFERPATSPFVSGSPYIVAFPGNDFYEFSMEGDSDYDSDIHGRTGNGQSATFEAEAVSVPVSDDMMQSVTRDGYTHHGTFIHAHGYGIVAGGGGSRFEAGQDILPFRTYLSAVGGSTRAIFISDGIEDLFDGDEPDSPADELDSDYYRIWTEGHDIIIETSAATSVRVFSLSGMLIDVLDCQAGINRFHVSYRGVCLVGRHKLLIR